MSDLISREKARNEILLLMKDMKLTFGKTTVWADFKISPTEAANTLMKLPSVDAVEVVRCNDCKHYDSHDHRCKVWNHGINVEDFCSRGEGRTDG